MPVLITYRFFPYMQPINYHIIEITYRIHWEINTETSREELYHPYITIRTQSGNAQYQNIYIHNFTIIHNIKDTYYNET